MVPEGVSGRGDHHMADSSHRPLRTIRRMVVALALALLAVALAGGLLLSWAGVATPATPTVTAFGLAETAIWLILGGLFYRDLTRRGWPSS